MTNLGIIGACSSCAKGKWQPFYGRDHCYSKSTTKRQVRAIEQEHSLAIPTPHSTAPFVDVKPTHAPTTAQAGHFHLGHEKRVPTTTASPTASPTKYTLTDEQLEVLRLAKVQKQVAGAYKKKEKAERTEKAHIKSALAFFHKESVRRPTRLGNSSTCQCNPVLQESPFITCKYMTSGHAAHLKVARVTPMDAGELRFAKSDHEFKGMQAGAHQCRVQHHHGKIKHQCKCCECDTRNQPMGIVDLGKLASIICYN